MRIAVDSRAAAEVPAGRGRYVRELLRALRAVAPHHELLLLARRPWDELGLSDWTLFGTPDPFWAVRAARTAGRADVLLATNSYLLAALAPVSSVAVVFDLVPLHDDASPTFGSRAERITLPLAVRRARRLVCISEAVRTELVTHFPRAESKAHAVPLGVDPRFLVATPNDVVLRRYNLDRPYVLATGTLEPRKNLARLIEAFTAIDERGCELVLAGASGWETRELDALLSRHRDSVRALGFVSDADLPGLYASAEFVCYPSLYEGFGLPVLEAMAAGKAVLTSNVSSLPEVGGDAVEYVDPVDVASIRAGIERLLGDRALREVLGRRARERSRTFTWERTARDTLEVLELAAV